jgi:hypothetical protein
MANRIDPAMNAMKTATGDAGTNRVPRNAPFDELCGAHDSVLAVRHLGDQSVGVGDFGTHTVLKSPDGLPRSRALRISPSSSLPVPQRP